MTSISESKSKSFGGSDAMESVKSVSGDMGCNKTGREAEFGK